MLVHTKATATKLVDILNERRAATSTYYEKPLRVVRIDPNDTLIIERINKHISMLLKALVRANMIEDVPPKLNLGSTRLIADKLGGFIDSTHYQVERPTTLKKALKKKKTFGDIDVDIILCDGASIKQITQFINEMSPSLVIAKQTGIESHICQWVMADMCIQIDLVDCTHNREAIEYHHFCSFLDTSKGLKGLLREVLVNSVARIGLLPSNVLHEVVEKLQANGKLIEAVCKKKKGERIFFNTIRWSMTHEGIKLVAEFEKIKANGDPIQKPYKVIVADVFSDKNKKEHLNIPVTSANMDRIAKCLGFQKGETLYHSILMLAEIKEFSLSQKQLIWFNIVDQMNRKLPTNTAGGQMSQQEYNEHIEFLKPYFKGIEYEINVKDLPSPSITALSVNLSG